VTHDEHHQHSHYLIEHADLQGFHTEEVEIMALVALYHRGPRPEPSHKYFGRLSPDRQHRVRQLAGLLRVAENLDRSHFQNVVAVRTSLTETALHILVATKADPQLEVWAAEKHGGLFEASFDRTLHVAPTQISTQRSGEPSAATSSPVPS